MDIKRITRHTLPTKYDQEPFGAICYCFGDNDCSVYVQIGRNAEPEWVPFGEIFELIFSRIKDEPEFQHIILELFNDNNSDNMLKFIEYLKEIYQP